MTTVLGSRAMCATAALTQSLNSTRTVARATMTRFPTSEAKSGSVPAGAPDRARATAGNGGQIGAAPRGARTIAAGETTATRYHASSRHRAAAGSRRQCGITARSGRAGADTARSVNQWLPAPDQDAPRRGVAVAADRKNLIVSQSGSSPRPGDMSGTRLPAASAAMTGTGSHAARRPTFPAAAAAGTIVTAVTFATAAMV